MIRISSSEQLLECFRPLDREAVELPSELQSGMRMNEVFPLTIKDYFAWGDPLGSRVYLVVADPEKRTGLGVVFKRDSGGGAMAGMCEWCHSVRGNGGVALLTAAASPNRRVGLYLCRDLSCKDKAKIDPGADDMPQIPQASERECVRQIVGRMMTFVRRQIF